MTPEKFRSLALTLPGAVESSHMNHPDFRMNGKVFATLGYPDAEHSMVKLTPEQQRNFLKEAPAVFAPSAGAWGRGGSTTVILASAPIGVVRAALRAAAENISRQGQTKSAPKPARARKSP